MDGFVRSGGNSEWRAQVETTDRTSAGHYGHPPRFRDWRYGVEQRYRFDLSRNSHGVTDDFASEMAELRSRRRRRRSPKQKVHVLAYVLRGLDRRAVLRIRLISIPLVHTVENIFFDMVFHADPEQRRGFHKR